MIDKNSAIPIYVQLKNILKNSIMNGEFGDNGMIPSETQLAEKYDITRTTVRRSLSELAGENLIRKEHGKGTFVSLRPVRYSIWNFTGFTDYLRKKGKIPVSKVLTAEEIVLNGRNYFKLERARGVKEGNSTIFLTIDTSCMPCDLFPGIKRFDFEERSLYDVMRREYQISPSIAELLVTPFLSDARTTKVFEVPLNLPLLTVKGAVSTSDNQEIELTQVIYSPNMDMKIATRISI